MKKKVYQEPMMRVVTLQQQNHILAGSGRGVEADRNSYGDAVIYNWDETN